MHFIGVGKAQEQEEKLLGVGQPGICTPGSWGRAGWDGNVPWGIGTEARGPKQDVWQLHSRVPQGSGAAIPSLSGPTLTRVLIASVDPKLEDCGGRWEEKGGKGVSKSLAWQASVSCSCWRDTCAQPPYTPLAGGWAGSLLPSRASCLFPASTAPKARAVLGPGASQRCRQEAALPPAPPPAHFVSR